jgi:hypothetical protein
MSSFLDYDHLSVATGDPNVINPAVSKWIPCDGRSIAGSRLAVQTGMTHAPDLRGKFVRGLNQFYGIGEPLLNRTQANPQNKLVGEYQEDRIGRHAHTIATNDDGTGGGGSYKVTGYSKQNGPTVSTGENDNDQGETRPKNISVYFYLRINP